MWSPFWWHSFLVDGFSVSDCGVCLHCCFGIRTWSRLSLHIKIILSSVRFLFVLCLFVLLPSLAWKMCLAPPFLPICAHLHLQKHYTLPCCIAFLYFTLFPIILDSSHCFFATPLFLVLSATAFPSPPNPNLVAMPSPGWHTVKLQHQPSASPAQSTARPLGMR